VGTDKEKNQNVKITYEVRLQNYIKEENKKQLISPLKSLAYFTTATGLIALILEVRYFEQFKVQIFSSRLSSILIAFVILLLANSKFGKKHSVVLIHILLISIISSFGVMIYLIPKTLVFNSYLISLIIFIAALFLSWEVTNQIIVAIYYNLVFAVSILLSRKEIYILPNMVESVILVLIISVMAVVASYINYLLRQDAFRKGYEISHSEKKFRNIFENSAEGIFQVSTQGKLRTFNPAFVKMLGYSNDNELINLNFFENFFAKESDWELLSKLLEKQGKVRNFRVSFIKKDHSEITVRMNSRLNTDDDGTTFYEGSIQDITQQVIAEVEKQKALEALKQEKINSDNLAKKALTESNYKSKFLANMSHEVRTPMNSVMGFLTLIENDLFESVDELKTFARDARLAAESLLDIINNILDISKIEAGKMDLDEVEFNISDEIQKATSIIGQAIRQKNLKLEIQNDVNIPEKLYGDPTRYRQIILNLLSNAVKFTDEGKITLSVKIKNATSNYVELVTSIEDTGQGIPSEKINLLFEPYVQVKMQKAKKEGTGLGLVISKEFVKLMRGEIKAESKLGVGSRFYFTSRFKLNKDSLLEEIQKDEAKPVEHVVSLRLTKTSDFRTDQGSRKRVLLVEDNPISQNLEMKILREVGYEVEAVSNGHDAIEAVKTNLFDIVLMDVEMTDMDGITATKKIRDLEGKPGKIPIIAVTAHSSMKDREKCLASGMDDYIAKPINIHFLKLTIDQWINAQLKSTLI
jgi:PAS domain S-box-containing protein